jgi:hypothetical protein
VDVEWPVFVNFKMYIIIYSFFFFVALETFSQVFPSILAGLPIAATGLICNFIPVLFSPWFGYDSVTYSCFGFITNLLYSIV